MALYKGKLSIPKFNAIKSNCRICIADNICPEHIAVWKELQILIAKG